MANNPTKKLTLVFDVDEKSKEKFTKDVNSLAGSLKKTLTKEESEMIAQTRIAKGQLKELKEKLDIYKSINTNAAKEITKELQARVKDYENALGISEEGTNNLKTLIKDKLIGGLESLSDKFLSKIGSLFKDAWEELETMLNYSRLSNAQTRELAFTYGFSASQAYGYSQAMSALGFQSEEDLFYANKQEIELFKEAFEKYSEKYQKLYDSGTFAKLLEFQVEMNEFKQDMKLEVVDFFMQNKETIKEGMKAIMEIAKILLELTSFLIGSDRSASRSAAISDTIANYSTNKVNNVNIDQTFNGVDTSQRQSFIQLGTSTIQQLIAAIQ